MRRGGILKNNSYHRIYKIYLKKIIELQFSMIFLLYLQEFLLFEKTPITYYLTGLSLGK